MMKNKKICFLQLVHLPDDDRVWFHQTKILKENGYDVYVISTQTDSSNLENVYCFDNTGMSKKNVDKQISLILNKITPNLIICDNPLAVLYASEYKKKYHKKTKIFMDVTEWYPSKKNLANLTGFKKFIKKLLLKLINLSSGFIADGFIFGEKDKAKFFKTYFKKKPFVDLPYYPDLKYIKQGEPKVDFSTWKFLYCGLLTREKGFYNVLNATRKIAMNNQNSHFILDIISYATDTETSNKIKNTMQSVNVEINFIDYLPFEKFCQTIADYDIFFDLREKDKETNRCLPIKLFYYMACGRPAIFTDLDAIKLQVPEINEFAHLTNPQDYDHISNIITDYIKNNAKYHKHSTAALEFANKKYNWGLIKENFVNFISNLIPHTSNH